MNAPTPAGKVPLSPVHAMLATVERRFDAEFVNRVANHPDVDRWVRGYLIGKLDFSAAAADPRNVFLTGEHGAMIFQRHQPGLYEAHTMVLPEGRGRWTLRFVRACLFWMFTRTDAMEIMTRVPRGNLASLALVRAIHGVYEFTNRRGWVIDGDPVPAEIYSMHVQSWIRDADGLRERGRWFHAKIETELARFGKAEINPPDDARDRNVGAVVEMIFGGQPHKGLIFYNRFAALNDLAPATLIGMKPLSIDAGFGTIIVRDNDFWLASCAAA